MNRRLTQEDIPMDIPSLVAIPQMSRVENKSGKPQIYKLGGGVLHEFLGLLGPLVLAVRL